MHDDPVSKLLARDHTREDLLRTLGQNLTTLNEIIDEYRVAWRAATGVGWAKADLIKAGFTDPMKLPRASRPRTREEGPIDE